MKRFRPILSIPVVYRNLFHPLKASTVTISVAESTIYYGDDAVITVSIPQYATGLVECIIGNEYYSKQLISTSGSNAVFTVSGLTSGTKPIVVNYLGNNEYGSCNGSSTITVSQIPSISSVMVYATGKDKPVETLISEQGVSYDPYGSCYYPMYDFDNGSLSSIELNDTISHSERIDYCDSFRIVLYSNIPCYWYIDTGASDQGVIKSANKTSSFEVINPEINAGNYSLMIGLSNNYIEQFDDAQKRYVLPFAINKADSTITVETEDIVYP